MRISDWSSDVCSSDLVVRAHVALKELREEFGAAITCRLLVGARLVFADGTPDIVAYPATRFGWGRLTRLLTIGNRRAVKGGCILRFDDLAAHLDDLLLIVLPESSFDPAEVTPDRNRVVGGKGG